MCPRDPPELCEIRATRIAIEAQLVAGIPAQVRRTVLERAEGQCERCFSTGPLELHHRKYRSRGGRHTVENLVALCGWGNHTDCHGFAHTATEPLGWSVHSWENPAGVIAQSVDESWWVFTVDGRRERQEPY